MKIRVLSPARYDLIEGYWFYEEREAGLGDYFTESIYADIETLVRIAGIHLVIFDTHRMVASRFPFSIYYSVNESEILVHAVLDNRRDPAWISQRLN